MEHTVLAGFDWLTRETKINEEHHDLVVSLLEETGYQIQGNIQLQESDFDFQWEVCDIIFDESKTIRKGIINTSYLFDLESKTIFTREKTSDGSLLLDLYPEGMSGATLKSHVTETYHDFVLQLLKQVQWDVDGDIELCQEYQYQHLWNIYDGKATQNRPTIWTFNVATEKLEKRE